MDESVDRPSDIRTFNLRLQEIVNRRSVDVHHHPLLRHCHQTRAYTGERIGVEYLLGQSGQPLVQSAEELDDQIDDGFKDFQLPETTSDGLEVDFNEGVGVEVDLPPAAPRGDDGDSTDGEAELEVS